MCNVPLFKCEWSVWIEWEILHLKIVWKTCDKMKQQQCDSQLWIHGIILMHFMDVDVTVTLMVFNYSGYICNFGRFTKVKLFPYFHFYTEIGIFTMHFLWNIFECSFTHCWYTTVFIIHKIGGGESNQWNDLTCWCEIVEVDMQCCVIDDLTSSWLDLNNWLEVVRSNKMMRTGKLY